MVVHGRGIMRGPPYLSGRHLFYHPSYFLFRYLERFVSLVYLPNELVYVSLIDDACSNEIHYYNLIFNVSNNTLS